MDVKCSVSEINATTSPGQAKSPLQIPAAVNTQNMFGKVTSYSNSSYSPEIPGHHIVGLKPPGGGDGAGAELWAGLGGSVPALIDSWPAQSEKKKNLYSKTWILRLYVVDFIYNMVKRAK